MYRKLIAKHIGYPVQDMVKKTRTLKTLTFLRESQYWDETRMYEYRFTKLKNIINFAYHNVPYYEKEFKAIKLKPEDIRSFDDLHKIPILTKAKARQENMNLVARGFDLKNVKKGKTGGTTGSPLIIYKDINNRSFTWAAYYRWLEWVGAYYYDSSTSLWGAKAVLKHSVVHETIEFMSKYLQNIQHINSFRMADSDLPHIYNKLLDFHPMILRGYLSAILLLARYIDQNNLTPVSPLAISTTTETLLPHHRSFLEKVFNTHVYDQYGCGELSAISFECPAHNGLHINQEHMICEILDKDDIKITNETGRVVGTDLDNYVMPFIRYENGDLAAISDLKCSCGVNQPIMSGIEGRSADTITLSNGSRVHGVFLTDLLYELNILTDKIQRFQAVQDYPGQLKLYLEIQNNIDSSLETALNNKLKTFFNDVELVTTNRLEDEENGKFKYLKVRHEL